MKSPSRVAVICSEEAVEWISCRSIASNLAKAYRSAFGTKVKFFRCSNWTVPGDIAQVVRRIHRYSPQRIVFVDYTPYPGVLIEPLKSLYDGSDLPEMVFHIYGDFTRFSPDWIGLEPILVGTKTRFVCASRQHGDLVSGLLRRPKEQISVVPFPVNPKTYFEDANARARWRRRLGVKEGELLVIYAGRFSMQKNCFRALDETLAFAERSGRRVHIALAGGFDDIGAIFFGVKLRRGSCRKKWRSYLSRQSKERRRMIRHIGFLGPRELRSFYNAGDIFLSLSLYHDEDFGMAPIEALFCGTPCVLSAWGGYRSFRDERGSACRLVPVRLSSGGLQIESQEIQDALFRMAFLNPGSAGIAQRRARARAYRARFSIAAVSMMLKELHSGKIAEFTGFNARMRKHAHALRRPPIFGDGPKAGGLYEEIYRAYLRG